MCVCALARSRTFADQIIEVVNQRWRCGGSGGRTMNDLRCNPIAQTERAVASDALSLSLSLDELIQLYQCRRNAAAVSSGRPQNR